MPNNWSLNLRVLDTENRPVPMATISIQSSPVPIPDIAALSGSDGSVSIGVPTSGSYKVTLLANGYVMATQELQSRANTEVTSIVLTRKI